jgi:hypothetical protein
LKADRRAEAVDGKVSSLNFWDGYDESKDPKEDDLFWRQTLDTSSKPEVYSVCDYKLFRRV